MYKIAIFLLTLVLFIANYRVIENNIKLLDLRVDNECILYKTMPGRNSFVLQLTGETPPSCFQKTGLRVVYQDEKRLIDEQIEQQMPYYNDTNHYVASKLTPATHLFDRQVAHEPLYKTVQLKLIDINSGEISWIRETRISKLKENTIPIVFVTIYFFIFGCLYVLLLPIRNSHQRYQLKRTTRRKLQKAKDHFKKSEFYDGMDLMVECSNQKVCSSTSNQATDILKKLKNMSGPC